MASSTAENDCADLGVKAQASASIEIDNQEPADHNRPQEIPQAARWVEHGGEMYRALGADEAKRRRAREQFVDEEWAKVYAIWDHRPDLLAATRNRSPMIGKNFDRWRSGGGAT